MGHLKGCLEGASGGAPSLWTLDDMPIKSPDMVISLHGVPFPSEGNVVCGGGGAFIPGTPINERRRALVVGHLSARDSVKGTLLRSPLLMNPKVEVFERYAKCPVKGPPSV